MKNRFPNSIIKYLYFNIYTIKFDNKSSVSEKCLSIFIDLQSISARKIITIVVLYYHTVISCFQFGCT